MTPLLLSMAYFGIIGVATMLTVGSDSCPRGEWFVKAPLYGIGMVGLLGQLLGAVGWRLTPWYFLGLLAPASAIVLFRWRRVPGAAASFGAGMSAHFATVLFMVPLAVLLLETVALPLTDYDGRVTWMLKARAIARERSITGPFFRGERSRDAHSHYPLLLPVAAASTLELTGDDDDHVARPVYALAAICFLLVLLSALRAVASASVATIVVCAVAWLPQVAVDSEGGILSGYADVPLMAFVALALLSVLRREAVSHPVAFGLQLAFIVCTKNEGLVFAGILYVLALARKRVFTRATVKQGVVVSISLAITMILLAHWRSQIPLEHDENYPRLLLSLFDHLDNYPLATRALLSRMCYYRYWGLWWPITALATVAGLVNKTFRGLTMALVAAIAAIVGVYITLYVVTNWTIENLAVSSANRLLMHLLPFAATIVAIGGESLRRADPPTDCPCDCP